MKNILSSKWNLSVNALAVFIGCVIASLFINPSKSYILGALIGSLVLVLVNISYVLYNKNGEKSK